MEEWKKCKLGDICKTNINSYSEKDNWSFVNYLDTGNITENKISDIQFIDLSSDSLPSRARRKVQLNDIIYSTVRPNQKHFGIIKNQPENFLVSTGFAVLHINKTIADPNFVFYNLIQNENTETLHAIAEQTTSAYPAIKPSDIENLSIKVPPLPTQQKIAAILSSLDDKIELNNKINTNLEQQAQALFKNWFVDFEPFDGKMPEGWKLGTVGDLCSTVSKTYKGNDSHVVLINTSDVEDGTILNHESVPNSKLKGQFKKTFQKNDILYSEIRPANKHYAFVDIETTSNYIASTKLMVIRPNEGINPHYLYHILTNPDLIQEMQHLAETRSGTFPQITFESELSTYQIPLLPKEEQDKLGELFEKIDNQIFHNIKENKMLSTIRDTLLPKVMNGEIKI